MSRRNCHGTNMFKPMKFTCSLHWRVSLPLRKHAFSNVLKFSPPKPENFQIKNSDVFHISARIIDCFYSFGPPRRGGSNEYPQSMFLSRNKKNDVYPCKPQFYYIKSGGFKRVKIVYLGMFYDEYQLYCERADELAFAYCITD